MLLKSSSEQEYAWRTSELYLNRAEAYIELYMDGNQATGQKAVDYTRDNAVDVKFSAGKLFMADVNMPVHKFRLIDFYI